MQNRLNYAKNINIENLPDPTASADTEGENENWFLSRDIGDVLHEITDHLTEEERLTFAVYKNSKKKKQNKIYQVFFKKYHGKKFTGSAITHKKKRILEVLAHVGALLTFKRTRHIDDRLREVLTNRQFSILMLYEKRMHLKDIQKRMGTKYIHNSSYLFKRVIARLQKSKEADIKRYLVLLGNVLRFSRTYPISKR